MDTNASNNQLYSYWFANYPQSFTVPACNTDSEIAMLEAMALSDHSLLRFICINYGYVLGKSGHIRLFGGKNNNCMSLFEVNNLENGYTVFNGVLIIASTSEGGLFALNFSKTTGANLGEVLFLPAKSLNWEKLGIGFKAFCKWALGVSESDLVSSGWIEPYAKKKTPNEQDRLVKGKVCVLESVAERSGD